MDYGKMAYLKSIDNENRLNSLSGEIINSSGYEKSNNNYDHYFTVSHSFSLPNFSVQIGKNVLFQLKLKLTSVTASTVIFKVKFCGYELHSETVEMNVGSYVFDVFKLVLASQNICNFSVEIVGDSGYQATINNYHAVVFGDTVNSTGVQSFTMSGTTFGDGLTISYVENDKAYYLTSTISGLETLSKSSFSYLKSAKSLAMVYDKSGALHVFRVDSSGNLYIAPFLNHSDEVLVDTNVSMVVSTRLPNTLTTDVFVAYIKNGEVYYREYTTGVMSSSTKVDLPSGCVASSLSVPPSVDIRLPLVVVSTKDENFILLSANEFTATGLSSLSLTMNVSFTVV